MSRIPKTFEAIVFLRERYYKALSGKESLVQLLDETEISEYVYNSNAIENSTLTLEETEKILMHIDLSRFISERELFEAKNLAVVMDYIRKKAKSTDLSKELLLLLHTMLLSNIHADIAGRFRSLTEWVKVGNYIAADPVEIHPLLDSMLIELQTNTHEHVIRRIAKLHLTFEHIHPFCDGNGRIGRVLNNFILLKEGYISINIAFINRADYYQAFRSFNVDGDTSLMEVIVGRALTNSYHKRLAYMEGKKIVSLQDFSRLSKQSINNVINKAQRQTIEAFIEKGIWKIGV